MSSSAGRSYERLCKVVLRRRTTRLHILSLFASYFLCVSFALVQRGAALVNGLDVRLSVWLPFVDPGVLMGAAVVYGVCVVPVLVVRKLQLTTARSAPRTVLGLLLSPSARLSALTYTSAAFIFATCYTSLWSTDAYGADPDCAYRLPVSRRSKALNERPLLIVFNLLSFALTYSVLQTLTSRPTAHWQSHALSSSRTVENIRARFSQTLGPTIRLAIAHSFIFPVLYAFIGRNALLRPLLFFLPSLRRHIHHALRVAPPLRPLALLAPFLIFKLFLTTMLLAVAWEIANTLFDVYIARPALPAQFATSPHPCLFNGIGSRDQYFQHQAFLELSHLARTSPARTRAIFQDMTPGYAVALPAALSPVHNPNAPKSGFWGILCRDVLLELGDDYVRLRRRGRAPMPAPAPAAAPAPAPKLQESKYSHPLKPQPASAAFRPEPPPSPASRLARAISSGLALNPPVPPAVSSLVQRGEKAVLQVEAVKRAEEEVREARKAVRGWWGVVRAVVGWGPAQVVGGVDAMLPRRELDVWAVEALSYLIESSTTLDPYGLAQRDVPRILEALTAFESELEALVTELYAAQQQRRASRPESKRAPGAADLGPWGAAKWVWEWVGWPGLARGEVNEAEEVLPLLSALKEAVIRIVRAYGADLAAFKFPPTVARRVQVFVDYAG